MIALFRRLRQKLIDSGSVTKYLLYATGEILLVVVGILIALQVNNWNETRKQVSLEEQTLVALKSEVEANLNILETCKEGIEQSKSGADSLRSYLGPEFPELSADSVHMWLGYTGSARRCNIGTNVLSELENTGRLSLISDAQIRRKIGEWVSGYEELKREEEEWSGEFSQQFIPYTQKWIQWDDVDYIFIEDQNGLMRSRFEYDPRLVLQQFEFANIMSIHYWRIYRYEIRLLKLQQLTKELSTLLGKNR